jgi:hypothetical protein
MASSAAVWRLLLLLDSTAADGIVMVCVVLGWRASVFLGCGFHGGRGDETVRFVRTIGGASDSYG